MYLLVTINIVYLETMNGDISSPGFALFHQHKCFNIAPL